MILPNKILFDGDKSFRGDGAGYGDGEGDGGGESCGEADGDGTCLTDYFATPASVDDMHSGLSDGNGYEDQRGEYVDPGLLHSIYRLKK